MSPYMRIRQTIIMKSDLLKESKDNNMSVDEYMISLFHTSGGGSIFVVDDTSSIKKDFFQKIFKKCRMIFMSK